MLVRTNSLSQENISQYYLTFQEKNFKYIFCEIYFNIFQENITSFLYFPEASFLKIPQNFTIQFVWCTQFRNFDIVWWKAQDRCLLSTRSSECKLHEERAIHISGSEPLRIEQDLEQGNLLFLSATWTLALHESLSLLHSELTTTLFVVWVPSLLLDVEFQIKPIWTDRQIQWNGHRCKLAQLVEAAAGALRKIARSRQALCQLTPFLLGYILATILPTDKQEKKGCDF